MGLNEKVLGNGSRGEEENRAGFQDELMEKIDLRSENHYISESFLLSQDRPFISVYLIPSYKLPEMNFSLVMIH
jgi:hypothetical protein